MRREEYGRPNELQAPLYVFMRMSVHYDSVCEAYDSVHEA